MRTYGAWSIGTLCCAGRFYKYMYGTPISHWTHWTWLEGTKCRIAVAAQLKKGCE